MPGQKRNELLTGTERERLINRRDMGDAKKRAANDSRAKKKLAAWADNLRDVELILEIRVKNFRRVSGDINDPVSWQTSPGRPANDLDIARSALLATVLGGVGQFLGADNPVIRAVKLSKIYADPVLRERMSEEEKQSAERCINAMKDVYDVDLEDVYAPVT